MADGAGEASAVRSGAQSVIVKMLPLALILAPMTVHFILVCFVMMFDWLPMVFIFSHLFFFLTGVWIIHFKDSILPVFMYIVVISVTILMDIIQLGLYFSDNQDVFGGGDSQTARTWQFSAAVMIISLMMKPLTIALACVAAYLKFGSHLSGAYSGIGEQST